MSSTISVQEDWYEIAVKHGPVTDDPRRPHRLTAWDDEDEEEEEETETEDQERDDDEDGDIEVPPIEPEEDPFDDFDDEDFDDDFDDDFEEELEDDYEIEPDDSEMFPEQGDDGDEDLLDVDPLEEL